MAQWPPLNTPLAEDTKLEANDTKKNNTRPRIDFPITDSLEAKAQGHNAQAFSKKKSCSVNFFAEFQVEKK